MTPDRLAATLRALANQVDRSPAPSASAVASKLLRMIASVNRGRDEFTVESGRDVAPARRSFDVANDAAYEGLLATLRNGVPHL